jgi:hypothetical protein
MRGCRRSDIKIIKKNDGRIAQRSEDISIGFANGNCSDSKQLQIINVKHVKFI